MEIPQVSMTQVGSVMQNSLGIAMMQKSLDLQAEAMQVMSQISQNALNEMMPSPTPSRIDLSV